MLNQIKSTHGYERGQWAVPWTWETWEAKYKKKWQQEEDQEVLPLCGDLRTSGKADKIRTDSPIPKYYWQDRGDLDHGSYLQRKDWPNQHQHRRGWRQSRASPPRGDAGSILQIERIRSRELLSTGRRPKIQKRQQQHFRFHHKKSAEGFQCQLKRQDLETRQIQLQ